MLNKTSDVLQFYNNNNEFITAVEFTAGKFGFSNKLIEKDYLCSLILMHLYDDKNCPLVFKGGTLLAKVHTGFYRLSEDLDFTIPISPTATRKQRSNAIKPIKEKLEKINERLPIFNINNSLSGSNESRQYNMVLGYRSQITNQQERILIEIGLREELLETCFTGQAETLLHDPFITECKIQKFNITSLSFSEAYAEKTRAALTRKKLAIRDFFDLDYAVNNKKIINLNNTSFIEMINQKIKNEKTNHLFLNYDDKNNDIINYLKNKIEDELTSTLRQDDVLLFDLNRIVNQLLVTFKPFF